MKWENKYVVFDVSSGPKVVVETLDTYGNDGWELASMVAVGGGERLVAFLKRRFDIIMPDPEGDKKKKISQLWGTEE
jgi:hypothetical protein